MQRVCTTHRPLPDDIRELTSIRFFAAIWVVLLHFSFELDGGVGILAPLIGRGDLGVDLFFILSGFILTHVYYADFASRRFTYPRYILYRAGRIYPLHLFTLGLAILVFLAGQQFGLSGEKLAAWGDVPFHLLMLHAWGFTEQATWNDPSWSISAEWFAYLATPAFFLAVFALARRPVMLTVVAVAALVGADLATRAIAGKPLTMLITDFAIARIAPEFLLGCALHRLSATITLTRPVAVIGVTCTTIGIVAALYLGIPDLVVVMAQGGLILTLSQMAKHPAGNPLRLRSLVFLGEISYAVYMVHALVDRIYYSLVGELLDARAALPLWVWLTGFPILIAVAALSHRCIEIPGRRIARRWIDRMVPH